MRNFTIIFRSTNSCNLNCKYCYDKNNHTNLIKENEEFTSKIPNIIKYIKKLWPNTNASSEIIFHGGEPLIINYQNYDALLWQIKKLYPKARFSIQTNATLLNKNITAILKKYNVHVGISLDGYDEITNKFRVYKNNKNSFTDVLSKIDLLKKENINFGIIMTLTNQILNKEDELYEFLRNNKLNCNIRPAFKCNNSMDISFMTNESYFKFFKKLFNIWIEDTSDDNVRLTQIKEIYDEFVKCLDSSYSNKSCATSGKCALNFISLDSDGNLYSCNRTYNNKEFFYGNINDIDIAILLEKIKKIVDYRNEQIKSGKCGTCEIYSECMGRLSSQCLYIA